MGLSETIKQLEEIHNRLINDNTKLTVAERRNFKKLRFDIIKVHNKICTIQRLDNTI